MARRSDHSRQELIDLALRNGIEIVENKGISGLSARQVTDGIGYTVGTLYHLFGSLDGFILHIHGRTLDKWHTDLAKRLKGKRGQEQPLRVLAHAYIDFARRNYNLWSALFEYRSAQDSELPDWYREKLEKLFQLVEEALLIQGVRNRQTASQTAKILWASIHGICVLSLSGKLDIVGSAKAEVLADGLLETYSRGMK